MSTRTVWLTARSDPAGSTTAGSAAKDSETDGVTIILGLTLVPVGAIDGGMVPTPARRRGTSSITTLSAPREPISMARSSRDAISRSSSMASGDGDSPVGR